MTDQSLVSSVVVAGRDVPLWLCAAALRRALGPLGVDVVAIELPTRLTPSHVSATLPPLEALHAKLDIDEAALLGATGGSFSLGQNVVDASRRSPGFFHAWGSYGAPIDENPFFPCWLKARRIGSVPSLEKFCLTALAAQSGRMLVPDSVTNTFGRADYGYHLPSMAYAGYLKSFAAAQGVEIQEARTVEVERDEAGIAALIVDGTSRIQGDFFVDATGGDAALMGRSVGVRWESWRQYLGAERVIYARAPSFTSIPPFCEIQVAADARTAIRPTQAMTGVVRSYSSKTESDEAAVNAASVAARTRLVDFSVESIDPGLRSMVWEGNCVAIGGAACVLDPVHGADLHVLQLGVVHLLSLLPVSKRFDVERVEYNRLMRSCCERIRDFQSAFYGLASFDGEFRLDSTGRAIPQALAHKIATFRARGAVAPMEDETFFPDSWQQVLLGLGVTPETWPPSIDKIAPSRLETVLGDLFGFVRTKVLEQPMHSDYVAGLSAGRRV